MANRYRRDDWIRLKRTMPPEIRRDVGDEAAPPGFMLVDFATENARGWVEERLGPSIEVREYEIDESDWKRSWED